MVSVLQLVLFSLVFSTSISATSQKAVSAHVGHNTAHSNAHHSSSTTKRSASKSSPVKHHEHHLTEPVQSSSAGTNDINSRKKFLVVVLVVTLIGIFSTLFSIVISYCRDSPEAAMDNTPPNGPCPPKSNHSTVVAKLASAKDAPSDHHDSQAKNAIKV